MKLSLLNVRAASETPAPMVLRNRSLPMIEQPDGTLDYPALGAETGQPVTLFLLGAHSSVVQAHDARRKAKFQTRMVTRAIAAQARRRGQAVDALAGAPSVTPDDILAQQEEDLAKVVACCVDWAGLEDEHGAPLPCNDQNKTDLFTAMPDAVAQALEFIEDTSRLFTK